MRAGFILSEVWSGLRRNFSMVISVVLVTFVSLLFVGAAILLQMQVGQMKDFWYDRVQVSVFLCPPDSEATNCVDGEVTGDQKDQIRSELESSDLAPYVDKVYFEDKTEAYRALPGAVQGHQPRGHRAQGRDERVLPGQTQGRREVRHHQGDVLVDSWGGRGR
jgi:cell division transport system permease protein